VGMNSWVIHQDKDIFGQDAASFIPERWLRDEEGESEEEYQARLTTMKNHEFSFGAGSRICLGKSISTLETYKVMASLFLTYDVSYG